MENTELKKCVDLIETTQDHISKLAEAFGPTKTRLEKSQLKPCRIKLF